MKKYNNKGKIKTLENLSPREGQMSRCHGGSYTPKGHFKDKTLHHHTLERLHIHNYVNALKRI